MTTTTETETRTAWAELGLLRAEFEEAKRRLSATRRGRREARAAVTGAEAALRDAYAREGSPEEVRAAREALDRARAEAEPSVWEGREAAAQERADVAGGAAEELAEQRFGDLAEELTAEGRGLGERLERAWRELVDVSREWNRIERRWRDLGDLLGERIETPESPVHELLLTKQREQIRVGRGREGWHDPTPDRLPEPRLPQGSG